MFAPEMYQLLDFGDGRRLETFGPLRLDRPCPGAEGIPRADRSLWERVDARFQRGPNGEGRWSCDVDLPKRWTISHGRATFELKRTEFGHLGLFPEQAANWDWLAERLGARSGEAKVLNLFAYTGGSTLAAAASGAEVVHVDAARNVVDWARRNAELSGLAEAPVRWITEDATKFVRREVRRGSRYDAVILDPPSYGHGPRGEVWRLAKHLPRLLSLLSELTAAGRRFVLLTCHTPGFDPPRLEGLLRETLGPGRVTAEALVLKTPEGRKLPSGVAARWEAGDN
jgi:23S rRNA (cytosine1962-C5)-methyltransferase